jgi:3',5'-cyclic AMP phosphodiesterase CpdA
MTIIRKIAIVLALLPLSLLAQERIMVISDPHVLASSLMDTASQSFKDMIHDQRKMLDLSEPAFMALIDTALLYKPDLVLIPGDMTKDSEVASHTIVVAQLQRLRDAGIPTLLVPGNHDIGGKAYAYLDTEKTPAQSLADADFENTYSVVYQNITEKDPNSHSFVAEPLDGITILGIDGAHSTASTSSLSEETLNWLLQKADEAVENQKMVIAMCHWQLLEHVDQQSMVMSSCRLENADAIRDNLMAHGVRLVLTGHFHVNGITTYRDTTGTIPDSIVEISTGSPITYPCPYRWLTIDQGRSVVDVETDIIRSLPGYPDLETYSREWMREHAANMVPQMTVRAFNKLEQALDAYESDPTMGFMARILKECLPETDSARIDLVERHMGSTIVELYLLHSEANEPEHPEADSLAQEVYSGMEAMLHEMTDEKMKFFTEIQNFLINAAKTMAQEPVQSLVEDKTNWSSARFGNVTDDLHPRLTLYAPHWHEALEEVKEAVKSGKIVRDGQLLINRGGQTYNALGAEIR